jgi:hypothetical protein
MENSTWTWTRRHEHKAQMVTNYYTCTGQRGLANTTNQFSSKLRAKLLGGVQENPELTRIVIEFMTGWAMAERGWEISFHEHSISVDSSDCKSIDSQKIELALAEAKTE